jgi:hypothetical protein
VKLKYVQMATIASVITFVSPASAVGLRLKQVMHMSPSSQSMGPSEFVPIWDVDGNGLLEMIYRTGRTDSMTTNPQRLEIGRFLPYNRWQLLWADTCVLPPLPGINRAYFEPGDVGDPDNDGLTDVVGHNWVFDADSTPTILCNIEQRSAVALPDSTTWSLQLFSSYGTLPVVTLAGCLDPGCLRDVLDFAGDSEYLNHTVVVENRGNDQYARAWTAPVLISGILAVGDLDLDGVEEFAGAAEDGCASVWRTCGDDQYEQVFVDSTGLYNGGNDCFFGRDVNRNGRPEFYAAFARYIHSDDWMCYLVAWEANGGTYQRVLVDSAFVHNWYPLGRSICADIDGDGIEEIIWATATALYVYKADAAGRFVQAATWHNYLNPGGPACANVNAADVNYDGYSEIVITYLLKAAVLEVEAIQLLTPSRRTAYAPGDTCRISWRTFSPPRCDSVSLFLRADTSYELDTIAHGLAPDDTPFVWIVPDVHADSAYVVAIAYGPGWQYDESDSAISMLGTGIGEERPSRLRQLRLAAAPNPTRTAVVVSYELPVSGPVDLSVLDLAGRRVASLGFGRLGPGRYQVAWDRQDSRGTKLPAGVYFVVLVAGANTRLVKLVMTGEER